MVSSIRRLLLTSLSVYTLFGSISVTVKGSSGSSRTQGPNGKSTSKTTTTPGTSSPPNVIIILADDLGWHDVGFSGSNISTPNIDRFATEGVRLTQYYAQPVCSPSRAAIHTARYPIAYGLQTYVIDPPGVDYGLNLNETILPQLLKQYGGYQTHAVGKWHLGEFKWEYTPTFRGYDTFHGYYSGGQDYFTHIEGAGFDLHIDSQPNCGPGCSIVDWNNKGTYSTELYSSSAVSVIQNHNPSNGPLFLYLAYQAVHSPDEVPQKYINPYNNTIPNMLRRTFAGMLSALDEGIGNVTQALQDANMLDNTLIFFLADNGGPIVCPENICGDHTGSTNFPLKGGKHSLFEGGVRVTAAVWGSNNLIVNTGVNRTGLMHHVDILPTILEAGNITVPANSHLPWHGMSQWSMVSQGQPSTRTEILLNIDPLQPTGGGNGNAAIIVNNYKLTVGETGPPWNYMPEAYPPPTTDDDNRKETTMNFHKVHKYWRPSPLWYKQTLIELGMLGNGSSANDVSLNYDERLINMDPLITQKMTISRQFTTTGDAPYPGNWPLQNMTIQLYDLSIDEYETTDISKSNPAIVEQLLSRIEYWATQVQVRPLFWNATVDPRSNPALHNGSWIPWAD